MPDLRTIAMSSAALVVVVGTLTFFVSSAQELPDGPVPIAFDKEACAYCHMHVGDPKFAAQLQTKDGRVYNFDDPGCMLRYDEEQHPQVHAIYFRDVHEGCWLERSRAAFVRVSPTPMGFGLGAVDKETPGAIAWDAARKELREWATRAH